MQVSITGSHSFLSDLNFSIAHGGVTVSLGSLSSGCAGSGSIDVLYDDDFFGDPSSCSGGYLGDKPPAQPLSAFDGLDMSGGWTLQVRDDALFDGGTITSWCVIVNPTP